MIEQRSQFLKRARPQHLRGRAGSAETFGDDFERKALQIPQDDDFAIILGKLVHRFRQPQFVFVMDRQLAGGLVGRGKIHSRGRITRVPLQRNLAPGGSFVGGSIVPDSVTGIVIQDLSQPGEPFLIAFPHELVEISMGVKHRLLNQVRGIHLGSQPGLQIGSRQQTKITAAGREQALARGDIPGPSLNQAFPDCY